ncbi:DNA-directed RNA polymerase [Rhodopseudomonas palustris]|uniref:DNA-directed RNA polymerase n=1 Tax=Rhodopseudomonas palustris (strain ATCC BAA-98 / CGA009) TaxID=258594 RepID=A0AAF0BQE2_RHOPA|nr:DNA-directed RNA polymerase [Rhodopseudomonas palustris]WAB80144.1 hypothetical protein OR798_13060 [Rhodopseudomonas palustris]WCL92684.1 hypothetical protein TX73_013055 [Rhodopseudomonas palustris CGA009]WND54043.1 hypothetical protein L1A21_13005 [Rhodopseudomonas palustris]
MEWLKVHLANCGDFGKVSKKTFDKRIKWTNDNLERIKDCATKDWDCGGPLTPEALSFWTQADKPFLFLAACIELTNALAYGPGYVCGLPCSWDGSCSGAQHLCAATRSEDAWKVNLIGNDEVHDLYTIVGNAAKQSMARDTDPMVSTILAYEGDWRKVFKRNTMTTFYGSKGFGMAQQHMDDLMEPLSREVMQKKRAKHPFGQTRKEHHAASRLLAAHAAAAIKGEIPLAIKAMEFIQKLSAMMAHEGKPLEWTTPIGLPWSNRYHDPVTERVNLWMHDHGVRRPFRPVVADGYKKTINKNHSVNGSAPNFVHACDAAHLLRTVNAARAEGITQFALVHDSFGSLPSHAARFRQIIREEFVRMYEEHDVLTEVLEQAKCDLDEHNDKLSALVDMRADLTGKLNIKEVLNAEYAFAYPKLSEPDTKGEYADGKYKTEGTATEDYTERFQEEIQKVADDNFPGKKNVHLPWKETKEGDIAFIFKNPKKKPILTDSRGKPLKEGTVIRGGSKIRIAGVIAAWEKGAKRGVSLWPDAVRVIKLSEGFDANAAFGAAEDGFNADDYEPTNFGNDGEDADNDADDAEAGDDAFKL